MASVESSGFMNFAENWDFEILSPDEWFKSTCSRAQKLIEEAHREIPGPLDPDPLPGMAKHWLIDLASEVSKGHLTVGDAQHIYCKIYRRFESSLMRYGGLPRNPNFSMLEDRRLRLITNFLQGADLFLYCLNQLQATYKQSDLNLPDTCE